LFEVLGKYGNRIGGELVNSVRRYLNSSSMAAAKSCCLQAKLVAGYPLSPVSGT